MKALSAMMNDRSLNNYAHFITIAFSPLYFAHFFPPLSSIIFTHMIVRRPFLTRACPKYIQADTTSCTRA